MNVQLDRFGEAAVRMLMQTGHWDSAAKLIADGLRVVKERHRLWNVQRREFVDGQLRPALRDLNCGKLLLFQNTVPAQIKTGRPRSIARLMDMSRAASTWEVCLTSWALRDLHYYWTNACDPSPKVGERFLRKVSSLCRLLKRNPGRGERRNELRSGLRSVGNYTLSYPWFVIFFMVRNRRVVVLRVLHWTYDPPRRLSFP